MNWEDVKSKILEDVYVEEELLDRILTVIEALRGGIKEGVKDILPRGIIFYGPPGTGKTRLMKTIAKVLDIGLVTISGPEILSEYYGRSERNLRRKFEEAKSKAREKGLSILFIDELDAIAPRRDVEKGGLEPRLVGQLLALMDGISTSEEEGKVIVIGATNRPWAIDPALRRPGRFDYEFEFDLPSEQGRKRILWIHLKGLVEEDIPEDLLKELAEKTEGFSGADIRLLVMEAFLALKKNGKNPPYSIDELKEELLRALEGNKIVPTALREMSSTKISAGDKEVFENLPEELVREVTEIIEDWKSEGKTKVLIRKTGKEAERIGRALASKFSEKLRRDVYFIRIPCNIFRTKWFGEGERMLRDHLDRALKLKPSVILLDHMDSISLVEDYNLAGMISELLTFLDRIEEMKDIICIGAIRRELEDKISSELREKFDKIVN